MRITKCDRGHFYDGEKFAKCPICSAALHSDNEFFCWKQEDMNVNEITKFVISFGNCPIKHIEYENGVLTFYNRINGSRDGWMTFPEGFFDKKTKQLSTAEINIIFSILQSIDFSEWKTNPDILDKLGCHGFCLYETFKCCFKNGKTFISYNPGESFKILIETLKNVCSELSFFSENDYSTHIFCEDESVKSAEIPVEDATTLLG